MNLHDVLDKSVRKLFNHNTAAISKWIAGWATRAAIVVVAYVLGEQAVNQNVDNLMFFGQLAGAAGLMAITGAYEYFTKRRLENEKDEAKEIATSVVRAIESAKDTRNTVDFDEEDVRRIMDSILSDAAKEFVDEQQRQLGKK